MTNRLTNKQKRKWLSSLKSVYGDYCFYCKKPFNMEEHEHNGFKNPYFMEYDHLNNREYDNRIENIVLCHRICNQHKKTFSDWQILAKEQLQENERSGVFVREREKNTESDETEKYHEDYQHPEIESNTRFFHMTKNYLESELSKTNKLQFQDTLDSIALMCQEDVGHGSQTTIRKHIAMLCCSRGSYQITKIEGKKYIIKKNPLTQNGH